MKFKKEMVLWGIFALQILFIVYSNFFLQVKNVDSDMAKLYVHAIEIFKNHNYVIPDWSYITTAEWDCSLLLAVPFYGITHNIFTAFACANVIFLGIWIWTIFSIFPKKDYLYGLVAMIFIMVPYGLGMLSYYNMMFFNGGQYIVKTLLPMMLIVIILNIHRKIRWKWNHYLFAFLYGALLFITATSSGLYTFLCGIIPSLAAYFVYYVFQKDKMQKLYFVCLGGSLLLAAAGYYVNFKLQVGSKGDGIAFGTLPYTFHDNIVACFFGIFELFEGATYVRTRIMSAEGIVVLARMVLVFSLLYAGYFSVKKILKSKLSELELVLLCSVFLMNTFILCVCGDICQSSGLYEGRYHLVGMIPLMILLSKMLVDGYQNVTVKVRRFLLFCVVSIFFIISFDSYKQILANKGNTKDLENISKYAEAYEVEKVIFDNSGAVENYRVLDNDVTSIYFVNAGGSLYTEAYDYYEAARGQSVDFANSILVIYGEQENDFTELTAITGYNFKEIGQEGEYKIYMPVAP